MKIIRSEREHEAALARLRQLFDVDPAPGTPEDDEFQLLALVIKDYERRTVPPVVVDDPVEVILFAMEQMGLSRQDMTQYLGPASKVSEVLSRKRPLSLPMIRRLHEGLKIPLDMLLVAPAARAAERAED
ncbi:MAG: transcriptional regulator [Lautropia sp.]|nr:transcriptional regulator [Lautropia sp.]